MDLILAVGDWMIHTSDDNQYNSEHRFHLSIHKKALQFDPRITTNPIIQDYLNDPEEQRKRVDRLKSITCNDANPYVTLLSPIIPASFRMIMQENIMVWVNLINKMIFDDCMFNTFYSEYNEILESVTDCDVNSRNAVIYREYKTGYSIFHTAAKIRIVDRLTLDVSKTVNQKIKGLDSELTYILNCYGELGKAFREGNEMTINYMEDFSGIYLADYITGFVDDLVNGSLFKP